VPARTIQEPDRQLKPTMLNQLCHLPAGNDADSQPLAFTLTQPIRKPRIQTLITMHPPNPDVGIQQNHFRVLIGH